MKFWEWQGRLYASADPGRGKTWTLMTNGRDTPEFWTWALLDGFTAREVWFGYAGEQSARQAAERIERTFWSEE